MWKITAIVVALGLGGCTAPLGEDCRGDNRGCGGGLYCCTEGKCGGGMCTAGCASDRDCPDNGFCESRICWRACASDADCPSNLRCKTKDGNRMCRDD